MDATTRQKMNESLLRSIEHLRTAVETEQRTVDHNRAILDGEALTVQDRSVHEQRLVDGETKVAQMRIELADLERQIAGDGAG